jgi:hypothetical protein
VEDFSVKRLLVLLLGLSFAPLVPAAETELVLPSSATEMEAVLGDEDPCEGCGVVTDVRQQAITTGEKPDMTENHVDNVSTIEITRDADGDIEGSGTDVQGGTWLITVRYDDGSYGNHVQSSQPSLQRGDRVQLVSDELVLR